MGNARKKGAARSQISATLPIDLGEVAHVLELVRYDLRAEPPEQSVLSEIERCARAELQRLGAWLVGPRGNGEPIFNTGTAASDTAACIWRIAGLIKGGSDLVDDLDREMRAFAAVQLNALQVVTHKKHLEQQRHGRRGGKVKKLRPSTDEARKAAQRLIDSGRTDKRNWTAMISKAVNCSLPTARRARDEALKDEKSKPKPS